MILPFYNILLLLFAPINKTCVHLYNGFDLNLTRPPRTNSVFSIPTGTERKDQVMTDCDVNQRIMLYEIICANVQLPSHN